MNNIKPCEQNGNALPLIQRRTSSLSGFRRQTRPQKTSTKNNMLLSQNDSRMERFQEKVAAESTPDCFVDLCGRNHHSVPEKMDTGQYRTSVDRLQTIDQCENNSWRPPPLSTASTIYKSFSQNFLVVINLYILFVLLSLLRWPAAQAFECTTRFGYYPHPRWCNRYYVCNFGFAFPESCAIGLQFSLQLRTCDWPRNVNCTEETGLAIRPGQPIPTITSSDYASDELLEDFSNADRPAPHTDTATNETIRHSSIKFSLSEVKRKTVEFSVAESAPTNTSKNRRRRPRIPVTVNVNLFSPTAAAQQQQSASADTTKAIYMPDVSAPASTRTILTTTPTPTTTTTTEEPRAFPPPEAGSYADPCDEARCVLPWCRCASADIPANLNASNTPQIVVISFDNAVNEMNFGLYQKIFNGKRVNPNGCPISATFFVSHQWTKYNLVQNLYAAGHEIASLGITAEYYEHMSDHDWQVEIAGERQLLATYANIPRDQIKGMRAPFLRPGGNKQLKMLYDNKFLYDSSYPIWENDPPYFPFTYDYLMNSYCMVDDCVEQSFPSVWEVPLVMWRDSNGARCHTPDTCNTNQTENGTYSLMKSNFERHYKQNRAPFTIFLQSTWFTQEGRERSFIRFLDEILALGDVYAVTISQAVAWMRHPVGLNKISSFVAWQCDLLQNSGLIAERTCVRPKKCNPWFENEKSVRFFETCAECPRDYPWTDNVVVV